MVKLPWRGKKASARFIKSFRKVYKKLPQAFWLGYAGADHVARRGLPSPRQTLTMFLGGDECRGKGEMTAALEGKNM